MGCKCRDLTELNGNEATRYARGHLEELEVDQIDWTIRYRCPDTGTEWLQDYPHSELHRGGPARLRRVTDSA